MFCWTTESCESPIFQIFVETCGRGHPTPNNILNKNLAFWDIAILQETGFDQKQYFLVWNSHIPFQMYIFKWLKNIQQRWYIYPIPTWWSYFKLTFIYFINRNGTYFLVKFQYDTRWIRKFTCVCVIIYFMIFVTCTQNIKSI